MDNEGEGNAGKGGFKGIFIIMIISLGIAAFWNSIPVIKNSVGAILNPTAGALLDWNLLAGMTIIVLLIALFMTLAQKYMTDQKTLRELKAEQKSLQEQMKKLERGSKEHTELTMKSMKTMGPMFRLSMRPIMYTAIPIILLFRWFSDYFTGSSYLFLGFLNWFWFYLVGSILFSSILRKVLKVV